MISDEELKSRAEKIAKTSYASPHDAVEGIFYWLVTIRDQSFKEGIKKVANQIDFGLFDFSSTNRERQDAILSLLTPSNLDRPTEGEGRCRHGVILSDHCYSCEDGSGFDAGYLAGEKET